MTEDDAYSIECSHCKYFGVREPYRCKRWMFPDTFVPYRPWFSCDREGSHHFPCCEFQPAEWCKHVHSVWTNFDEFMKIVHASNGKMPKHCTCFINGDHSVAYQFPIKEWIYGDNPKDGTLIYTDRFHYKRTKDGFGYRLQHDGSGTVELQVAK